MERRIRTRSRREDPVEEAPASTSVRRRSRQASPAASARKREVQGLVQDQLKLISKADQEIANLMSQVAEHKAAIETLMRGGGLTEVMEGIYTAKIYTKAGRSSSTVNVAKFREEVDEDTFNASISVQMGVAKQVLSEKELKKVVDVEVGNDVEVFEIAVKKGKK